MHGFGLGCLDRVGAMAARLLCSKRSTCAIGSASIDINICSHEGEMLPKDLLACATTSISKGLFWIVMVLSAVQMRGRTPNMLATMGLR